MLGSQGPVDVVEGTVAIFYCIPTIALPIRNKTRCHVELAVICHRPHFLATPAGGGLWINEIPPAAAKIRLGGFTILAVINGESPPTIRYFLFFFFFRRLRWLTHWRRPAFFLDHEPYRAAVLAAADFPLRIMYCYHFHPDNVLHGSRTLKFSFCQSAECKK